MKKSAGNSSSPSDEQLEGRMHQSLQEIEDDYWDEPTFPSSLVARVHQLRKVPLCELCTEDLRVAIGQKVGVRHLLPLALTLLEQDPFAEGDYYPGDLLSAVARAAGLPLLREQPRLAQRLTSILGKALGILPDSDAPSELEGELRAALGRLTCASDPDT